MISENVVFNGAGLHNTMGGMYKYDMLLKDRGTICYYNKNVP